MPPKIRYDREAVLQAAYRLARSQGAEAVNARAIARELGCSTQPIFRAFSGMDELRQELLLLAKACYNGYMARSASLADKPYKGTGMAYILFAREEPHLFRMLFMRDRSGLDQSPDAKYSDILHISAEATGLDIETSKLFHLHMWIYVHGLATMAATNYLDLDDELISTLLTGHFRAMLTSLTKD